MIIIFPIVGLLLLIPMIAMHFYQVNWSFFDFLIMGIMPITGLAYWNNN